MSAGPKPHPRPSKDEDEKDGRVPEDAGFDRWLNRQLHKIYDPILDETIPDDINDLLERFERRDSDEEG